MIGENGFYTEYSMGGLFARDCACAGCGNLYPTFAGIVTFLLLIFAFFWLSKKAKDKNNIDNIMTILCRIGIILSILLLIVLVIYSLPSASAVPVIKPYVNDFVGVLSSSQIQTLNEFLLQLETDTTYEIAVVITKDTEGQDANSYATAIGNANEVGQKGKENGIIVLVAIDSRDIYIATGRGTESIISDAEAGRIGRDNAKLYFPSGQYYEGIYHIVQDLSAEIRKPSNAVPIVPVANENYNPEQVSVNGFGLFVIFFVIFTISLIWGLFHNLFSEPEPKHYGKKKSYKNDDDSSSSYVPVIIPSSSGGLSSSGGFSSGGGGGFGSFGGGSFGGGGGGGKW